MTAVVGSGWLALTSPNTVDDITEVWSLPGSRATLGAMRDAGLRLPRNDPRQYDELAGEWWQPDGAFAMLHWLAQARAALVPPAARPGALLVDLGCGAGLLAPHLAGKGYRHVGVDLTRSALAQAVAHGVTAVNGDAVAVPLIDGCADVVAAGELLEHVPDWRAAVAEACRLLRPGGLLVVDTLNDTALSRLVAVRIAERLPTVPRGIHDPRLFVDDRELVVECARHGVDLRVRGVRPGVPGLLRWLFRQTRAARAPVGRAPRIVPTRSTAVLYQGRGVRGG
ncbi:hypothetical protein GCM10011608_13850 [Micromonospora sonchi]|uniref:Methyltransferase type 11 domain-containing protein n=2 Tax=Micromonospora sonchi TaxID=1763543 RepID=A0A917TNG5_9ACTN|nr:hypothetical protein GCM10011608_13850 [Micromonospora sonchi]